METEDWSDAIISQGRPEAITRWERGMEEIFLRTLRKNQPYQHLDFGFLTASIVRQYILVLRNPRKPIYQ